MSRFRRALNDRPPCFWPIAFVLACILTSVGVFALLIGGEGSEAPMAGAVIWDLFTLAVFIVEEGDQ